MGRREVSGKERKNEVREEGGRRERRKEVGKEESRGTGRSSASELEGRQDPTTAREPMSHVDGVILPSAGAAVLALCALHLHWPMARVRRVPARSVHHRTSGMDNWDPAFPLANSEDWVRAAFAIGGRRHWTQGPQPGEAAPSPVRLRMEDPHTGCAHMPPPAWRYGGFGPRCGCRSRGAAMACRTILPPAPPNSQTAFKLLALKLFDFCAARCIFVLIGTSRHLT